MINVKIEKNHLVVTGHAGWAQSGLDIVCASVSTAVIMTINQIEIFNRINKVSFKVEEGYCEIVVNEEDEVISNVILNLTFTLKNLELDYPKYIKKYENL